MLISHMHGVVETLAEQNRQAKSTFSMRILRSNTITVTAMLWSRQDVIFYYKFYEFFIHSDSDG